MSLSVKVSNQSPVPKRRSLRTFWPPIASAGVLVLVLVLWQQLLAQNIVNPIILPSIPGVVSALGDAVTGPTFWPDLARTLYEIVVGFAIGAAIGLALAMAHVLSKVGKAALYPYIVIFQATPHVVMVPIVITWFGFGPDSKIVQAAIGAVFPVFINAVVGLTVPNADGRKQLQLLGASPWQVFRMLRLPAAVPAIVSGFQIGLTFSTVGAIVSETVAGESGLGVRLTIYQDNLSIAAMYGQIIAISIVALLLYLIVDQAGKRIVYWEREPRRKRPDRMRAE
jgi:NitT/TauT family transport system permease protein